MYGSPAGVAALASTWTEDGEFTDEGLYDPGTIPSLSQVTEWLEQVSSFVDIALSGQGFTVPVSHVDVKKAIDLKANTIVADLVKLQHSKGRLFSDRIRETGEDPLNVIEKELFGWVVKRSNAFENLGIPRLLNLDSVQAYSIPMGRQK